MSDVPGHDHPCVRPLALLLALALGLAPGVGAGDPPPATPGPQSSSTAPPPLGLEEDAPLLLEEALTNAPLAAAALGQHGQDINAACYVCHVNFKQDAFVQWHASTNIGCVKCHGQSREHVADEANLTPPDILYWPSRVAFSCFWCHPRHDVPARDVLARWQERCPQITDARKVLCTHCHGSHRLPRRSIVWNKRTRALISKTAATNVQAAATPPQPDTAGPMDGPVAGLAKTPPDQGVPPTLKQNP